jgi:Protein of unknown function (DUF2924)
MRAAKTLEEEVAALGDLSREELAKLWEKAHKCPPPKGVKRALLERSAAWHVQASRLGGLSPMAKKVLRSVGRSAIRQTQSSPVETKAKAESAASRAGPALRSGTRLMREWNGRMHAVDVTDDGFLFDGKSYRSLSAIARRITGAQWSGPRFFGL